jgi:hypothetical protein
MSETFDYYKQANEVLGKARKISRSQLKAFTIKLLKEQGGVCAICSTDTPGGRGQFHADHDHNTNQPRGVLCHNCNVALGNFKDNPELLQKAIEYLNKHSEVK